MDRTSGTSCSRARVLALLAGMGALVLGGAWAAQPARSASSDVVVTMDVVGATTIDPSGCAAGTAATSFGTLQPGAAARAPATCSVVFGSPNATASLRVRQHDGTGTAMTKGSLVTRLVAGLSSLAVVRDGVWIAAGSGWPDYAMRTADGGSTWSLLSVAGTDFDVEDVEVDPTGRVWMVGTDGQVRRSDDEGVTWSVVASGTTTALEAISWASASTGWIVANSGLILSTTDGGATWTPQPSGTGEDFRDLHVVSATHVFVSGRNGTLLETTDGGATWSPLATGTGIDLYDVETRNGTDLVAIGRSGLILWSDDGGASWNVATGPYGPADLRDVEYLDDDVLMAIGTNGGWITTSSDGGKTWTFASGEVQGWELEPTTDGNVLVAGDPGTVLTVDAAGDGARTWTMPNELRGAAMPSEDVAWIAGGTGGVRRTTDRGATWQPVPSGSSHRIWDMEAPTEDLAITVHSSGHIRRTDDGGQTWTAPASGTGFQLNDVAMYDDTHGWIASMGGRVRRTTDGGQTWTAEDVGGGVNLWGIDAGSPTDVWHVGDSGTIRYSATGGAPWSGQASGTVQSLRDVSAVSDSVVWVVGNAGTVLRTTDGGSAWDPITAPGATDLRAVEALDAQRAVIAGYSGYVRMTSDGGATWTDVNPGGPGTSGNVEALALFDLDHVLTAFGPAGTATITDFAAIPDYGGGNLFTSAGGAFGACLETVASATQDWLLDGGGDCTAVDADPWNPIPLGVGHAGALVAHTTLVGEQDGQADLRFGVRVPDAATPGRYAAGVTFEVVAAS